MWNFWLGQETFEAYKLISKHPRIKFKMENPYRLTNLDKPDYCFFPWPDHMMSIGIWLIFVAIILFWVYRRINKSDVYAYASLGCGGLGISFLMGFTCAYPPPVFMLLAVVSLTIFLGSLSCFFTVLCVDKLPYFGINDKYLIDNENGFPLWYISYIISAIIVVFTWNLSFSGGKFFWACLGHNYTLVYLLLALMIAFGGVFGNAALPYITMYDRPLLGGGYAKILEPLLKKNGKASRSEVICAVILFCALYTIILGVFKEELTGDDYIGVISMACICMGILHGEIMRTSDNVKVVIKRDKGLWN